jgi:hypothetical protein
VKGKIVVTSSAPYQVHTRALNAGALGTISYYSSRALIDPIQIPNLGIGGKGFAFLLPPRDGMLLRDRLIRRENIEVEVKVKSEVEPVDLLVPQCLIQGTDTSAGEVIFTAHIFEGYVKMGANDNMSGAAVILEVAHLLNDLINSGKIPRPEHGIRFLWIPEFSGTIPWVNRNLQRVKKAICNLNLDMVGLNLRENRSFFTLYRSGFSTAHYVNDVMESYYRYVGETNAEGITDELGRRGFSRRIVSQTGTDDPFYYRIFSMHGSSDNAVFNEWSINVPGIKMNTWPDLYYHSSEDNPDKCDPTQLRRAIFIAAAGSYTMALGGEEIAMRILSEMQSSAGRRLGIQLAKSEDMIWKSDRGNIEGNYKRALFNLEGYALAEKAAFDKIIQVSSKPQVISLMNSYKQKTDDAFIIQQAALKDAVAAKCRLLGIPMAEIRLNEYEKKASNIIPVPTEKAKSIGSGGLRRSLAGVPPEFLNNNRYTDIVNTDEAAGLADGRRNLLEIKKMTDAQFEAESPAEDIINFFNVLQKAGLMTIQ